MARNPRKLLPLNFLLLNSHNILLLNSRRHRRTILLPKRNAGCRILLNDVFAIQDRRGFGAKFGVIRIFRRCLFMKKVALTVVCAFALSTVAFAQGRVVWRTTNAQNNATINSSLYGVGSPGGGAMSAAAGNSVLRNGFYFELLFNTTFAGSQEAKTTNLAGLAEWPDAGVGSTNATVADGIAPGSPATQVTVPLAAGVTNNIMLVGWSPDLGNTWRLGADKNRSYGILAHTTTHRIP
jgi:hypothetical protein